MISSSNKVVVPLAKDLIVANCTVHGVGTNLMWTVPTRLDQTPPSASDSLMMCERLAGCGRAIIQMMEEPRKVIGKGIGMIGAGLSSISEVEGERATTSLGEKWRWRARKSLSPKLKGSGRREASLETTYGWKSMGTHCGRHRGYLATFASMSLLKFQRKNLQNKVIYMNNFVPYTTGTQRDPNINLCAHQKFYWLRWLNSRDATQPFRNRRCPAGWYDGEGKKSAVE